jgi:hypothetical protein
MSHGVMLRYYVTIFFSMLVNYVYCGVWKILGHCMSVRRKFFLSRCNARACFLVHDDTPTMSYWCTRGHNVIVPSSGFQDFWTYGKQVSGCFFLLTYARRLKNRVSTAIVLQGCGRPAPRMNTNSGAQGNRSRKVGPITLSRKGLISPGQLSTLLPGDTARKRQKSRGIRADQDVRRRGQTRPP